METIKEIEKIRKKLKLENDNIVNLIDMNFPIILPFKGNDDIKLIIIGQDPTIQKEKSRKNITITLNLNKKNALRTYIDNICKGMNISIENVYATNIFKYFYTNPPAKTMNVLKAHLSPNLELLKKELEAYNDCIIITLGEPVLQLLTNDKEKVKEYWGYDDKFYKPGEKIGIPEKFKLCNFDKNLLGRNFYPFPHQPSIRKEFYKNTIEQYVKFVRE